MLFTALALSVSGNGASLRAASTSTSGSGAAVGGAPAPTPRAEAGVNPALARVKALLAEGKELHALCKAQAEELATAKAERSAHRTAEPAADAPGADRAAWEKTLASLEERISRLNVAVDEMTATTFPAFQASVEKALVELQAAAAKFSRDQQRQAGQESARLRAMNAQIDAVLHPPPPKPPKPAMPVPLAPAPAPEP
jgi:hypothetical protein